MTDPGFTEERAIRESNMRAQEFVNDANRSFSASDMIDALIEGGLADNEDEARAMLVDMGEIDEEEDE